MIFSPAPGWEFRTIDLGRHAEVAIAFCRDAFTCSFGSDARFIEENGADGRAYIDWLRARIARYPDSHVHLWKGEHIVGQLDMLAVAPAGFVNLFYLAPSVRGTNAGEMLHAYAVRLLERESLEVAHLSVSPTNARALRYYQRHGWKDLGPRPGSEFVHGMELTVPARASDQAPLGG